MKLRSLLISGFFIRSLLVISIFLLIFISGVSYKHTTALTESTGLLVHSYKIQIRLEQLISTLKDAETGQRGYIISRDSVFLEPYFSAKVNVQQIFSELKSLTTNHTQQYNNLDSIGILINLRFSLLAKSLDLIKDPSQMLNLSDNLRKGKKVMDLIRIQINKMIEDENLYFNQHEIKYAHELNFTPLSTLFLIFFSLIVFVLTFIKINKDIMVLKKTNADLTLITEAFKHAEEIGNFSSWQWYIDTNEYLFSDNHYRLLGVTPQSFDPTIENFLKFVHPDDRHILEEKLKGDKSDRKPSEAFFRIIRNDGQIKYFKTVARLSEVREKQIFIGINSDISEQYLSSLALEERNRELEQSNNELASFNHIASHDLQEPLRKIQIFISRILEKESSNIDETSAEYFSRVQHSIKKMRILINDLLLFSRTVKTEKIFERANLNVLLENAQQELSSDIEEKNAIIKSSELPVLNVIPFQIQQLFLNLIGNSLKYSRKGIIPVVSITNEYLEASEKNGDAKKKYCKITISDNGQGFDQKYSDSIFLLFYRIDPGPDSSGSGIGLSICKKIAENHSGFITVQSKPGTGSAFSVFLPV